MEPLVIYGSLLSPPTRAVWLAAKALNLEWEHKEIDLFQKQQLQAEYVKINPQHTIPLLDDNGVVVWDSHAIMAYLVGKFGESDSLYPKDLAKRAIVDQRLHFDSGVAFPFVRRIFIPMVIHNKKTVTDSLLEELNVMYGFVNAFLEGHNWICGDDLTIADFGLLATLTILTSILPADAKKYPNIEPWIKRAEELPYFNSVNAEGTKLLQQTLVRYMSKFD